MSPIPADLPLIVGEPAPIIGGPAPIVGEPIDEFRKAYFDLNVELQRRGYLPPNWDINHWEERYVFTAQSQDGIMDFRRDRGIGKPKNTEGSEEQDEIVEEEGFEGRLGTLSSAALERSWCSQPPRATWVKKLALQIAPEQIEIYKIPEDHWNPDRPITYRVKTLPVGFSRFDVEQEIQGAFALWERPSQWPTFAKVEHDDDLTPVIIEINFFQRRMHSDKVDFTIAEGKKFALAHAFYPVKIEEKEASDIHFNDDEEIVWTIQDNDRGGVDGKNRFDLKTMIAHEIGHAIGLRHVGNPESVMHADYTFKKSTLHADDLTAFEELRNHTHPVLFGPLTGPGTGGPKSG